MKTSTIEVKRKAPNSSSRSGGFSLLEILIALFLVILTLSLGVGGLNLAPQKLENLAGDLERALRFSSDEATLRNAVVRLHFDLSTSPQEYAVEFGPEGTFLLPDVKISNLEDLSSNEQEKQIEQTREWNGEFNKIKDFQEKNKTLEDGFRLVGVATTIQEEFITDFYGDIYHYPTGERDGALIVLASATEVLGIFIAPFSQEFRRVRLPLGEEEEEEEAQNQKGRALYEEWKKASL